MVTTRGHIWGRIYRENGTDNKGTWRYNSATSIWSCTNEHNRREFKRRSKKSEVKNITLTRANKKLNDRISELLKQLDTFKKVDTPIRQKSIGTQTGTKNNRESGTYIPRDDETFIYHEDRDFGFGSTLLKDMDIFARPIKYIEGQYLLINYVFVAKAGQKFEFGIFLKKRFGIFLKKTMPQIWKLRFHY